jgi:hypothetical protein
MDTVATQRLERLKRVRSLILADLPCSVADALDFASVPYGIRYARTALWDLLVERQVRLQTNNQLVSRSTNHMPETSKEIHGL